jgi:hypothetical protein
MRATKITISLGAPMSLLARLISDREVSGKWHRG